MPDQLIVNVRLGTAVSVLLEPGGLLILRGAARYAWKHGIGARKTDTYADRSIPRRRRTSLTFRTAILPS